MDMDETEAISELKCLSDNAKRWLEDRIGNGLAAMVGYGSIGMPNKIEQASDAMVNDLGKIGIFEMQNQKRG